MSGGDLQTGAVLGSGLEVRRSGDGSVRLSGRFPYNSNAVLSDGGKSGRPIKERIAPGAFKHSIESEADIHFLAGHSFDRPLASKNSGSLQFRDTPTGLELVAMLTPAILRAAYAQDAIAQIESGLVTGLSPGFRLPPDRAVPRDQAEQWEDEEDNPAEGMHRAKIRTILQAILVELSLVTRPAYQESAVEMARAAPPPPCGMLLTSRHRRRWRV
ncbi:MAG: HK97 family phage prohead protease [Oceanicaulis sp.]